MAKMELVSLITEGVCALLEVVLLIYVLAYNHKQKLDELLDVLIKLATDLVSGTVQRRTGLSIAALNQLLGRGNNGNPLIDKSMITDSKEWKKVNDNAGIVATVDKALYGFVLGMLLLKAIHTIWCVSLKNKKACCNIVSACFAVFLCAILIVVEAIWLPIFEGLLEEGINNAIPGEADKVKLSEFPQDFKDAEVALRVGKVGLPFMVVIAVLHVWLICWVCCFLKPRFAKEEMMLDAGLDAGEDGDQDAEEEMVTQPLMQGS